MKKLNKVELSWFVRWSSDENKYKRYIELYDEIERLNKIIEIKTNRIQNLMSRLSKRQDRIDKAIEYIEEHKRTYENNEYCFDNMLEDVTPLLDILKGSDKE